ncbi:hypothetical protein JOJ87_000766 [Rhodococcus ruber]|nr:hypothetical protein [Rhodococcus ruber]
MYKLVDRIVHGVPPTLVAALIVAVAVLLIVALSTAAP